MIARDLTVLVTGGSRGIGEAVALEYARGGARLALFARTRDKLEAVAARCLELGAAEALPLVGDTTKPGDVAAAMAALAGWPRIDRAWLNAGGNGADESAATGAHHPLECCRARGVTAGDLDAAAVEAVTRLNYLGVVYWLDPVLARMRAQGGGTIAATGGMCADRSLPRSAPYSAAKAALRSLFEGLRVETQAHAIQLVLLEPGFVDTDQVEAVDRPPFLRSAEDAARRFVAGVERGEAVIRYPWQLSVLSRARSLVPRPVFDAWARWALARHDARTA